MTMLDGSGGEVLQEETAKWWLSIVVSHTQPLPSSSFKIYIWHSLQFSPILIQSLLVSKSAFLGTTCKSGVIRFTRLLELILWMMVVGLGSLQTCSDSYPKTILLSMVPSFGYQYNILLGLTQQIGSGVNGQLLWNSAWQFCFCETLDPRSCSFCSEDQIL